jgi:hypothetical protein
MLKSKQRFLHEFTRALTTKGTNEMPESKFFVILRVVGGSGFCVLHRETDPPTTKFGLEPSPQPVFSLMDGASRSGTPASLNLNPEPYL